MATTKHTRDYKKEYAARTKRAKVIEKNTGVKLSRAQIRGHAKAGETPIKTLKTTGVIPSSTTKTLKKYRGVVKRLASGESLTSASRALKTTSTTMKRIGLKRGDFTDTKLKYRAFRIYTSKGAIHDAVQLDSRTASIVGRYLNIVKDAHLNQDARKKLTTFKPGRITDVFGSKYTLATDYETLALMGVYNDIDSKKDSLRDEVVYRTERVA